MTSTGSTGALIGDLHSDDRVSGLSFNVPLRDTGTDAGSIRRGTGNSPWRLDGDYNTRFLFTNTGPIPATFTLNIAYDGGTDSMPPRSLAPGASAVFDLRRMRDENLKEGFQKVIPRDVDRGIMLWSIRSPASARLAGRAEIMSVSRRVTGSYTW